MEEAVDNIGKRTDVFSNLQIGNGILAILNLQVTDVDHVPLFKLRSLPIWWFHVSALFLAPSTLPSEQGRGIRDGGLRRWKPSTSNIVPSSKLPLHSNLAPPPPPPLWLMSHDLKPTSSALHAPYLEPLTYLAPALIFGHTHLQIYEYSDSNRSVLKIQILYWVGSK